MVIFGKVNRNLQWLTSLANGCLRWLYPASSKTQVLNFFPLLHNTNNSLDDSSFFYSPLFNSEFRKKNCRGIPPPPCTFQNTPMYNPSRRNFLHSVRCNSELSDTQVEERSLCEHFPSISQVPGISYLDE
jgi:hypothetical protein